MRKRFLSTIVITFALAVIMMPGPGLADINVQGIAQMMWNSPAFESSMNWIVPPPPDPTGVDTRGSFSGVSLYLNDVYDPFGNDSVDGVPWATTGFSTTLADGTGSVNGQGYTTPSLGVQEAISSINLTSPASAGVDIAQGVLLGQFTVAAPTTLDISTTDYRLMMSLFNDLTNDLNSFVSVSVGFTLSDFDQTDPNTGQSLVLASDSRDFSRSLIGMGSDSFTFDFQSQGYAPLHLVYNLVPGVTYDFEAQASTTASVPEPMSLILVLSGMAGLVIFRKRFA